MKEIYIVDSFSHKPYSGNPAPIMMVNDFPGDMQKIAAEFNFATTAFVKKLDDNHFHVRWFSPMIELKFCGHALLAAAHIVYQNKLASSNRILINSLSGQFEVLKENNNIVLNLQLEQTLSKTDHSIFKTLFNIKDIKEAFCANNDIIVVLNHEEDIHKLHIDFSEIKKIDAQAIIVTAPSQSFDFISRVFAPRVGINEDPVTGSSHCKLAYYWSTRLNKQSFKACQASARGGEIDIQIKNDRVFLKGGACTLMSGQWFM